MIEVAGAPPGASFETGRARPLSIAMVAACPFPTRQGTQVVVRHLATALARAGHEVHLITYGHGEYDAEFEFHLHRASKVPTGLRSGPSVMRPAADAALLVHASRVIAAHRCDVLHVHNIEGLGVGALLKLQLGTPLVYHAHNAMGPELPTYFRGQLAQAFAGVVGDVLDRTLPRAADAVITFDPDHKSLHEVYGVHEKRLFVIPPGLDLDEFGEADPDVVARCREELGEGPLLLYAGNPDAYQNLRLLWAAFAQVRAARPEARLVIASSYSEEEFKGGIAPGTALDGVVFRRYRDFAELRALLACSDGAVCPRSLWVGAPIKVLNYLAAGLPVVAVRSGARHLLNDEVAVIVDDDPDAFAAACLRVLHSPPPAHARQRRWLERFRVETHVPSYEQVYRGVLAKRGS